MVVVNEGIVCAIEYVPRRRGIAHGVVFGGVFSVRARTWVQDAWYIHLPREMKDGLQTQIHSLSVSRLSTDSSRGEGVALPPNGVHGLGDPSSSAVLKLVVGSVFNISTLVMGSLS